MSSFFTSIYLYFSTRRRLLFGLLVVVAVFFVYGALRIDTREDITGFLPSDASTKHVRFVTSNIDGSNSIIFNVNSFDGDKDYSIVATEFLVSAIDSMAGDYVDNIFFEVDDGEILSTTSFVLDNLPYFIDSSDYRRLDSLIVNDKVGEVLSSNVSMLSSFMAPVMEPILRGDPLSIGGNALRKLRGLNTSGDYNLYLGYLFDKEFEHQIVVVTARFGVNNTAANIGFDVAIEGAIAKTLQEFKGVDISYFGAPLIALQNAQQIKSDSYTAIALSLLLILALMYYALRSFRSMILVALPVIFGAIFAFGLVFVIQGSISAIAIGAGSIIFGIAISYSIHYVWHLNHSASVRDVIGEIAQPMTIGSLSTVGAFLSLLFIKAESMRDFGLFAALSLTGSILFVLIFLPHIKLGRGRVRRDVFGKISSYRAENSRWLVIGVVFATIILAFFASKISFESDMQKINYMTTKQRSDMASILAPDTTRRTICVASVAPTMDEALRQYCNVLPIVQTLTHSGLVEGVSGFGDFVIDSVRQQRKVEQWSHFWQNHSRDSLIATIESKGLASGFVSGAFDAFYSTLGRDFTVQQASFFSKLPFVNPFLIVDKDGSCAVVMFITTLASNSDAVIGAFNVGGDVVAFDQNSINASMVAMLISDFNFVLYICSFIVFGLLLISFARIEISIVAFLPMVISWVWIMGIMGIFGINFNIINIILATFIFGLGDDFSIFITDGLMHEYAYGSKITASHKSAVVFSSLTMLFGVGTLIFAKHPAMLSLAYVTIIGMFCVVVAAYVVPPVLFKYLVYKGGRVRLVPITAENFVKSIYSFLVFLFGTLFLTLCGFVLLTIMGRSDVNKLRFHKVLHGVARFIVRYLPMVKSEIKNPLCERFERGSVIVANHQSHLDLMYILALGPKIIIATNGWVWRSPFYGIVIRYADFFPIVDGVDAGVERLRPLIDSGYSVVVFAEGTRCEDGNIRRFHKGAFYLAQQLGVDILPVLLHGVGGALPKQEFLLRHSFVVVEIMARLQMVDMPIQIQAKYTRSLMSERYESLRNEVENCNYFGRLVRYNYLYKGIEVERRACRELKEHNNYERFVARLPTQGVVVVENCGIGVGTLMASLVRRRLTIYATDKDSKNLMLASNCGGVPSNLRYVSDISAVEFDVKIDLSCE